MRTMYDKIVMNSYDLDGFIDDMGMFFNFPIDRRIRKMIEVSVDVR